MLPEWTRRASAKDDGEGSRKPPRTRSVRTRITALLIIPLLSLIGLWAFAASVTVGAAVNKFTIATAYDKIGTPGSYLSTQLQQERALTAVYIGSRGRAGLPQLQEQRTRTDAAHVAFRKSAQSDAVRRIGSEAIQQRLTAFTQQLDQLGALRDSVDGRRADVLQAINGYSAMTDAVTELFNSTVISDSLDIYQQGRALITTSWALDYMLREDALVMAAQVSNGRLSTLQHNAFLQWSASQRQTLTSGLADLDGPLRDSVQRVVDSPEFQRFRMMEGAIVNANPNTRTKGRLPAAVAEWQSTSTPLMLTFGQAIKQAGEGLNKRAQPIGDRIVLRLAVAGGLGLVAVVASILLSILFARRMSRELGGLQAAARDLAEERLPRVVARLRRGEDVDVNAEAPPLQIGKTTEIARVSDAFARVQRTAIDTAVGEAYLRKGVSRVFLNLAWRSQSLLHRQLRMLDAMERRASEPEELEDLFRLDHLTTRMRRHAEGLVILSGAPAGRGWSRPVRIVDVLRGALGEVEDYTRVDVVCSSPASLAAAAVADVIHLLAELIENATAFSPPPTEVLVRGEMVANGFAVEIVDRGIGLSPTELDELNQRLARPPEFDLADSDRLGLFVVSRLAARHGVRVTLQQSAYGGTTAVVLMPHELIVAREEPELESPADESGVWRPQPGTAGAVSVSPGAPGWFEPRQIIGPALVDSSFVGDPVVDNPVDTPVIGSRVDISAVGRRRDAAIVDSVVDADEDDDEALPRRIRQANLVPQLRKGTAAPPKSAESERRPEDTRDLMASLQTGWLRGRGDEEEEWFPSEQGKKEGGDS
ncbi:sensor histidine kinase [Actinomadura scrupuli]|uniref:sensor histidine kinase n=1 Tax=Actinomadura scrupuli TaxID=559629 RepID=UPI003D98A99A